MPRLPLPPVAAALAALLTARAAVALDAPAPSDEPALPSSTSTVAVAAPVAVSTGVASIAATDRPKRRNGLVLGLTLGPAFGYASGYPNNPLYIGQADYESKSGLMVGSSSSLLLMGALTDYLNFGFQVTAAELQSGSFRSSGTGMGFRADIFPFPCRALSDLAFFTQFGLGMTTLDPKDSRYNNSDGAQTFVGLGVFHEWSVAKLLGGHLSLGPSLEYDAILTRPMDRHTVALAGRLVFYGDP